MAVGAGVVMVLLAGAWGSTAALGGPTKSGLAASLDALLASPGLKGVQVSAAVRTLGSPAETLYERNAATALIPASAVKLLTGYLALKHLGPEHVFLTSVWSTGRVEKGVLNGDLYLQGGGDPSLVSERLYMLAEDVARAGITRVEGDVVVDATAYSDGHFHPSRLKTDSDRPFNAPTSAVSFNYNTTAVYAAPGESAGAPARIFVEPDTGYVKIVNRARTTAGGSGGFSTSREGLGEGQGDRVTVTGSIPAGADERLRYMNVTDPETYAGYALRFYLEKEGMRFQPGAKVRTGTVPESARKLGQMESLPVREIVALMNKYSNNFLAEALVKAVGGKAEGYPTSLDQGMEVVMREARALGLNGGGFVLSSPSGLNRENRMSARHFLTLLERSWSDLSLMPELFASLPIAGRDGTLEKRADELGEAVGRVRAKTGTLDGVATLAGVAQSRTGTPLAFALLLNAPGAPDLRPFQNRFMKALAE
ncbi:MAG: D-alanyl-D-alanine carboxypeptidase/D-alanyl-D-alanine-endopeptidase [Bdellovibrionales bacterium]|nr:D-alanyl-D-alanine carboxypeptidase/D-alanyl-D-alanine-endopeptidase [Bdellovibrionales bacterium]